MSTVTGAQVVSEAQRFLGDPYVYGATGPSDFDCSGLVQYVYKQLGLSLPRTSEEQYTTGTPVTADQLQAGDLVFAAGSDGTATNPGHVGIYDGQGGVIEAPHTGEVVQVSPLSGFGAVGYRRPSGLTDTGITGVAAGTGPPGVFLPPTILPSDPNLGGGSTGGGGGSLFSIPADILQFFDSATEDAVDVANFFAAFFMPSTYIRIASGFFGVIFLITGMVFLMREAQSDGAG